MKRYTIKATLQGVQLIEKKNGELVKYADVETLGINHDGLVCEISQLQDKFSNLEGLWVDECAKVSIRDNEIEKLKRFQIIFKDLI